MSGRLAGELSLLAAAAVSLRGVWDGWTMAEAVESALWVGGIAWAAGFTAGEVLRRMAIEHVAAEAEAGETPEDAAAETETPRPAVP